MNGEIDPSQRSEASWEGGEFGPLGYRFRHIAAVYAANWHLERAALEHRDEQFANPFVPSDMAIAIHDVAPEHLDAAIAALSRSTRKSDRALAGELLWARQAWLGRDLDYRERAGGLDPDAEIARWIGLIEHEPSTDVLQEFWNWLPKDFLDDDSYIPTALEDFAPLLRALRQDLVNRLRGRR